MIVYAIVVAIWMGGLVVLGVIVAPTVFSIVPPPTSGDAMTVVFRKFDGMAITCGVVALVAEAALAWRGGKTSRVDLLRAGATVLASALAILVGAYLAPTIQDLHRQGAVRGYGPAGILLARFHRHAELAAKIELVMLLAVLVLLVRRTQRPSV